MDANKRVLANIMFQNRVLLADGTKYEDLFTAVMTRRYPTFTPVRPYGRLGDRSNDGYIREEGRYYQVYAPENPATKANESAAKAVNDFEGVVNYWKDIAPVREYHFAFNDKFKGSNPPLETTLAQIEEAHGLERARAFLAKDLANEFNALDEHEMALVLGTLIPDPTDISGIDYEAVREVIQHLLETIQPIDEDTALVAPDFNAKIQINGLSGAVASLLRVGNYQAGAVERYFETNSEFSRERLRDYFAQAYAQSKESTETSDQAFFALLSTTVPEGEGPGQKQVQDATIVLIAYYFESCDVFEEPSA